MKKIDEQYSEEETQRRFEKLLRSALTTPPKPLKSMSPKSVKATQESAAHQGNLLNPLWFSPPLQGRVSNLCDSQIERLSAVADAAATPSADDVPALDRDLTASEAVRTGSTLYEAGENPFGTQLRSSR